MNKLIISLIGCILLSVPQIMLGQLSLNIKNKIEAPEGIALLRHGYHAYRLDVTGGKVNSVIYRRDQMTEIKGAEKSSTIQQLLGIEQMNELYPDLNCECLSLWHVGNFYSIFEISTEARKEDYSIHYHILRP